MADSLLDVLDWDDLDSADLPLAVSLLASATQERLSISNVTKAGSISASTFNGKNVFPYKSNSPAVTTNDGDPLIDLTVRVTSCLAAMASKFADIEKWDDADTDSEKSTTEYNLSMAADAPGTYANRLQEVTGYTSYPDLSVYAPEEVKKWFDMVTVCKYVLRDQGVDNDDYRIYDGIFDIEGTDPAVTIPDGAEIYASGVDVSITTPYTDFKSEQDALFGTTIDSFDESTDSGTYPPSDDPNEVFQIRVSRAAAPSTLYSAWTKVWQTTYISDWVDSRAEIGFTGRPLSYKNQTRMESYNNNFPTGQDTNFVFPASTTAQDERYYTTNVVTQVSDRDEIALDHLLSAVTLPATIATLSQNEVVEVDVFLRAGLSQMFLEFWDADGGFEYYTP